MPFAIGNGGTADKIEAVSALGAGSAVSLDYHVTQADKLVADTNPTSVKLVVTDGQITTATTTKITTDPASTHEAMVRQINITNTHATSSCTVQLQHTVGAGTARKLTGVITLLVGESLQFNGDGTMFVFDAVGGVKSSLAAAMTRTVLSAASSGTYVPPAGCRAIDVICIGGGGGSAGAGTGSATATISGGGGSGAYARKLFSPPSASYAYTVGAAGTAGASTPTAGGNGGTSSFGGVLSAPGGNGGPVGPAAGTTDVVASGGIGANVATGGDVNASGSMGAMGHRLTGTTGISGGGGDSVLGGGGNGRSTAGVGSVGDPGTGGGGGGSFATSTAQAGAAGSAGVIVITEYY